MNKKILKNIGITALVSLLVYYFTLPPINPSAPSFWVFISFIVILYFILSVFGTLKVDVKVINAKPQIEGLKLSKGIYVLMAVIGGIFVYNLFVSPLFAADAYSRRIAIDDTKTFTEDVKEVDLSKIPLLDKDSSRRLGDRTMGSMVELVSQFYVSDLYTQINYKDDIVRVTPLGYADMIKYFTNRSEGVQGYIIVNSTNGESELVKLDEGMKYVPSALFFENLTRKLRITYPTAIFGQKTFEIDDEGNPYWIVPTIKYVGVGLRKEIKDVIILDPVTGDSKRYAIEDVPEWVSHVYNADLLIDQINNWGSYRRGFWNSLFGQRDVINTTEGYNYLAFDGDVYMYTGITSVAADQSILGFVLTNMRTKKTNFYSVPGAKESSAMASAEGLVQEKRYVATFPLLINLNNRPTYLLSLKDNAGLVKMHAFIDVADYQRVVAAESILGVEAVATRFLREHPVIESDVAKTREIEIRSVRTAVIDGVTFYYFTDREGNRYHVSINIDKVLLPFIEVGQRINVEYFEEGTIKRITRIIEE